MQSDDGHGEARPAFRAWLLKQRDCGDWVDGITDAARADRAFPRQGDPEAVHNRLRERGADGDAFAALEDAETDWMRDGRTRRLHTGFTRADGRPSDHDLPILDPEIPA